MESPELHLQGPSSYPHPIRERNGKAAGLHRLLFQGHRSYPQLMRERIGGFLAASAAFSPAQIISLAASAAFSQAQIISSPGAQIISSPNGKAPWLHRLLLPGHRSYPRPIGERNGKAPRPAFGGAQIISHILTELGRGMGWLLGCVGCFFTGRP